jgi:hypothetical protein
MKTKQNEIKSEKHKVLIIDEPEMTDFSARPYRYGWGARENWRIARWEGVWENYYTDDEYKFREQIIELRQIHLTNGNAQLEIINKGRSNWFNEKNEGLESKDSGWWGGGLRYTPKATLTRESFQVREVATSLLKWEKMHFLEKKIGDYLTLRTEKYVASYYNEPLNFFFLDIMTVLKELSVLDDGGDGQNIKNQINRLTKYIDSIESQLPNGNDKAYTHYFRNFLQTNIYPEIDLILNAKTFLDEIATLKWLIRDFLILVNNVSHFLFMNQKVNINTYLEYYDNLFLLPPEKLKEFPELYVLSKVLREKLDSKGIAKIEGDLLAKNLDLNPFYLENNNQLFEINTDLLKYLNEINFISYFQDKGQYLLLLSHIYNIHFHHEFVIDKLHVLTKMVGEFNVILHMKDIVKEFGKALETEISNTKADITQLYVFQEKIYGNTTNKKTEEFDCFIENRRALINSYPDIIQHVLDDYYTKINKVISKILNKLDGNPTQCSETVKTKIEDLLDTMRVILTLNDKVYPLILDGNTKKSASSNQPNDNSQFICEDGVCGEVIADISIQKNNLGRKLLSLEEDDDLDVIDIVPKTSAAASHLENTFLFGTHIIFGWLGHFYHSFLPSNNLFIQKYYQPENFINRTDHALAAYLGSNSGSQLDNYICQIQYPDNITTLICQSNDFAVRFHSKISNVETGLINNHQITSRSYGGDHYSLNQCKVLSNGIGYCEGEKTTALFAQHRPVLFQHLDGNIGLLFILLQWFQKLHSFWSKSKQIASPLASKEYSDKKFSAFEEHLISLQKDAGVICADLTMENEWRPAFSWLQANIDDMHHELLELQKRPAVTLEQLRNLGKEIGALRSRLIHFQKDITEQISQRRMHDNHPPIVDSGVMNGLLRYSLLAGQSRAGMTTTPLAIHGQIMQGYASLGMK